MVRNYRRTMRNRQSGGKKFKQTVGSRVQVWHGTAEKTSYGKDGLRKKDLVKHKGRILSRKKHNWGKRHGLKQLRDAGYTTQKGKFGAIKIGEKGKGSRRRTRRRNKTRRCRHKSGPKKGKYKKCRSRRRR